MLAFEGRHWFVVHTKHQAERLTADTLARKGFQVYLPMLTKEVKHARATQVVARPLFVRYLFVGLSKPEGHFSEVRKSFGVEWLVASAGKPAEIPYKILEQLEEAERNGDFDETKPKARKASKFKPGDRVLVCDGNLDIAAEIMATPSDQRIHVILNLFGRKTKATVALAKVRALG